MLILFIREYNFGCMEQNAVIYIFYFLSIRYLCSYHVYDLEASLYCSAYLEGVIPNFSLKCLVKYLGMLNPTIYATSETDIPFCSNCAALFKRSAAKWDIGL